MMTRANALLRALHASLLVPGMLALFCVTSSGCNDRDFRQRCNGDVLEKCVPNFHLLDVRRRARSGVLDQLGVLFRIESGPVLLAMSRVQS
jgi:hypothetical protein